MCHSLPKRKYNQCGWLTQLTGKNHANVQLYQFVNEHDENGNVVASNQIFNAHSPFIRQIGMVYDNSDRLWTEEMYVGGNQEIRTYTYDPAHNRIQLLTNYDPPKDIPPMGLCIASLQNTLPNSLNQIEESDTLYVNSLGTPIGGTKIVYTYDLNGNRETRKKYVGEVTAGVLSYPGFPGSPNESGNYWFNSQGQLTELEHTGSANHLYTWVYDHRGRRVSFTDDDGTTTNQQLFSFSGGTSIFECPAEGSAGDSVWYARAYGMGGGIGDIQLTFQSGSPSGIYTTHSNFRGDVILKAEYSTAPTWMATYSAWGEVTQDGASPNRQYSNSKDRDVDGLANEGFRYRDPETGAFLSRDPAGMVDGPNLYNYVKQNPWSSVDPNGLWKDLKRNPKENWADITAEEGDTWEALAKALHLNASEAKAWAKGFDLVPVPGKTYKIPNTVVLYTTKATKIGFDGKLAIATHFRKKVSEHGAFATQNGFKAVYYLNSRSRRDFENSWKTEGIWAMYFAGHGTEEDGFEIPLEEENGNGDDRELLNPSDAAPPYRLSHIYALFCYSALPIYDKNVALLDNSHPDVGGWRQHLSSTGVFLGYDDMVNWANVWFHVVQTVGPKDLPGKRPNLPPFKAEPSPFMFGTPYGGSVFTK